MVQIKFSVKSTTKIIVVCFKLQYLISSRGGEEILQYPPIHADNEVNSEPVIHFQNL